MTLIDTDTTTRTTWTDRTDSTPPRASDTPAAPLMARPRARRALVDQPVERLEADVIDLSGRLAVGTYELLVLVGELDERGSWAVWGSLSCAA